MPRCTFSSARGSTANPLTIRTRVLLSSALEEQPLVIRERLHHRGSFDQPLAAAKQRPHPRVGQLAKGEEETHRHESHAPAIDQGKSVTLAAADPLGDAHAQDAAQKPRRMDGFEKKEAAAWADERNEMAECLVENGSFAAGHGQTRDGEPDVEATHQVGGWRLQRIVQTEVDREVGVACLVAGGLQGRRGEIEPGYACAAASQVPASASGSAGDVDDLETTYVPEHPIEDGHLPLIPITIVRIARPIAAREPLVHLRLHVPIRWTIVKSLLREAIPHHLQEGTAGRHRHSVSIRIAPAARSARSAASARSRPTAS